MATPKLSFSLADFFVLLMVSLAITALTYPLYQKLSGNSLREKQLNIEIAENHFKIHGDCAGAKRWSKEFRCD